MTPIREPLTAVLEARGLSPVITLWFDGACEPRNPGGVATGGWIIRAADGEMLHGGHREFCRGDGATNNVAEWMALALRWMLDNHEAFKGCVLKIHGDSQLVVNQLNGDWACNKQHLQKLRDRCLAILSEVGVASWIATWIPREQNEEADALSRLAYEESTGKKFPARVRR